MADNRCTLVCSDWLDSRGLIQTLFSIQMVDKPSDIIHILTKLFFNRFGHLLQLSATIIY